MATINTLVSPEASNGDIIFFSDAQDKGKLWMDSSLTYHWPSKWLPLDMYVNTQLGITIKIYFSL
jgi:hypothetical protein